MATLRPTDLRPGDVLLYHSTAPLARLIGVLDDAPVYHAGLVVGADAILEVQTPGLACHTWEQTAGKAEWIAVRRHRDGALDLAPVVAAAEVYHAAGPRYGFEQIVLLAVLLLNRQVALTSGLVAVLATVLDAAAAALELAADSEQEALICSDFVVRCFADAADRTGCDAYRLGLVATALRGDLLDAVADGPATGQAPGLLGRLLALPGAILSAAAPVLAASRQERALATLLEQYLADAGAPVQADDSLEVLGPPLHRFAAALVRQRLDQVPPTGDDLAAAFASAIADLVSPGDLLRAPGLVDVGTIPTD